MSKEEDNSSEIEIWVNGDGYEYISVDGHLVPHHRLLACRDENVETVSEKECHHRIPIEWLNIPENIEPVSREEHVQIHMNKLPLEQEILD